MISMHNQIRKHECSQAGRKPLLKGMGNGMCSQMRRAHSDGHDEGLPGGQQQGGQQGGDERPDQAAVLAVPRRAQHRQLAVPAGVRPPADG